MEDNKSPDQTKPAPKFLREEHCKYLLALEKDEDIEQVGSFLTEHLKVGGAYWCLTSLACLKYELSSEKKRGLVQWLKTCQNADSGFGGNTGHDSHITSTHYAVLLLILFDAVKEVDVDKIANYVAKLQNEDGSFKGDEWGEVDTRFSYCALSSLTLLNKLELIDTKKAGDYALSCRNFDGGLGMIPGMESHGAYCFTGTGAIALAERIEDLSRDELGTWLSERQTIEGRLQRSTRKASRRVLLLVDPFVTLHGRTGPLDRQEGSGAIHFELPG